MTAIKIKNLTSWELVDLMLIHLADEQIGMAKIYQDEILSRTYSN